MTALPQHILWKWDEMSKISTTKTTFLPAVTVKSGGGKTDSPTIIVSLVLSNLTSGFGNAMNFASHLRNQISHCLLVP